MTIDTSGPAFPTTKPLDSWGDPHQGMTLRDYFAAKVVQGMLASGNLTKLVKDDELAEAGYTIADAILKARGTP